MCVPRGSAAERPKRQKRLSRVSLEHVDYHSRRPFSTASRLDPARRECPGDTTQAANTAFLYMLDDRPDIGHKAISGRAIGF
jgi:hypothetical protein